jgi:hypothetical protein
VGGESGSDFGPSFDSGTVRFRRSSKSNSARDSPAIFLHSEAEAGDSEMVNDVGLETRGRLFHKNSYTPSVFMFSLSIRGEC